MKTKKTFFQILLFAIFVGATTGVFAIGMVTDPLIIDNAIRGQEAIRTLKILNPNEEEAVYAFEQGGDVKGWFSFFKLNDLKNEIDKITVPPKTYYDVIVKLKVPVDVPNGWYMGNISIKDITAAETEKEDRTVAISKRVMREVRVEVSDNEIIDVRTDLIPEKYDLRKGESLKIRTIYDNRGNIFLKPNLQIKITNTENERVVFNAIFPYPENENPVIPGERKEVGPFEWQTSGQEKGLYRAEIKTLINGDKVEEENFNFTVGRTTGINRLLAAIAFIGGGSLTLGWIMVFTLLTSLAIIMLKKWPSRWQIQEFALKMKNVFRRYSLK